MKRLGEERGALNLNPHFHLLALDGVFCASLDGNAASFTPTRAPAASEVRELAQRVHERFVRMMRRRGLLRDEADDEVAEPRPLSASSTLCPACLRGSRYIHDSERSDLSGVERREGDAHG